MSYSYCCQFALGQSLTELSQEEETNHVESKLILQNKNRNFNEKLGS